MKLHLVQRIRPWLFALSLGCLLCFGSSSPVAAGFSLRCVAGANRGDTSQAEACGYESDLIDNQSVLFAAWYDVIFDGRARTMQTACVAILIGAFLLRKVNYH